MKIACAHDRAVVQALDVLKRRGIRHSVQWEGGSAVDERIWVFVTAAIDPTLQAAIQRDIAPIAGATVQE